MLSRKMSWVLLASTFAVVALIFIQLSWIKQSRELMEQAFNHRVCMALCSTIEDLTGEDFPMGAQPCSINIQKEETSVSTLSIPAIIDDSVFHASVANALDFFKIDLDYQLSVSSIELENEEEGIYQCSANPGINVNAGEQFVTLEFAERDQFIFGQMRLMLWLSVIILLFISAVFVYANWMLWREKQQAKLNVDFFNNMAHEFRTPLTNIHLATRLLAKSKDSTKQNSYTTVIERENKKLLDQVERVLYLAHMEEDGEYQLKKERVNLTEILLRVVQDMDIQLREKNAQIDLQLLPKQLYIEADHLHLGNVFRNLIENALKYSSSNLLLQIAAEVDEQNIKIFFKDNGIGISKKEQLLIFNKFQRVATGNIHNRKGFGLGLAYVDMIMKLHRGMVSVQSELHQGSRFELQFPR